jgi:hypothetical protein
MALQVLEFIPLVLVFVIGTQSLVTGRQLISWYPYGVRPGWRLRLFGLVYVLLALFFAWLTIREPVELDSVAILWVVVAYGFWVSYQRRPKERPSGLQDH